MKNLQKTQKTMKWLNKFENGGQVENTLRKVMSSLTSLIKRSQKNDPEAKKQIQAILDDPNAQQMLAMIEQQSPELIEALHAEAQNVQMAQTGGTVEYLDSLKCGGRVKKAKKKEEGGEMTKNRIKTSRLAKGAKAPCPCSLKRMGGTIVEVDCEGNVISSKFGKGGRIPKHGLGDVLKRIRNNYTQNLTDPYGYTVSQKEVPQVEKVVSKTPQTVEQFQQQVKPITETPILVYRTSTQSPGRPQYDINTTYMYNNGLSRVTTAPVDLSVNPNIANQSGYIAYPSGTYKTVEADRANNFLSELNGDLPSILNPKVAPNAPYVDLAAAKEQALQASQQTYNQQEKAKQSEQEKIRQYNNRVNIFYSKMSDSDKRALQDMLKSAGYYKGEIDGLIGNGTLSALRKFQQDNKLAVDGMAGRNTIDALRAKTRQVAQPTTDPTAVPGYTQAMQLLNQMNGSVSVAPVKTGGPTGGMALNDVHQDRDVQLVGPKVGLNLTAGLEIPQRKQGGWLNKFN